MRRIAVAVSMVALAGAGFVAASFAGGLGQSGGATETTAPTDTSTTSPTETTTPTTTTTTPASKPKPRPRPKAARVPVRVKVGGIYVGGLTPDAASAVIRLAFRSSLVLLVDGERVTVAPRRLGAKAYIEPAVSRALRARPGASVPLFVTVRGTAVHGYVAQLVRRYDREVRDAKAVLRNLRPRIVEERDGYAIRKWPTVTAIVQALRQNRRGPVVVPARTVRPKVTAVMLDSVVVIRRASNRLYYYRDGKFVRVFPVATGQSSYPTPLGSFRIVVKWRDPWWYPPPSPWAAGAKPIPPGPGNPLGTRWMGLSAPAVGIHGTPDAASLGYSASHGCIRMAIPSAEWLFERVEIGTPVFIVNV